MSEQNALVSAGGAQTTRSERKAAWISLPARTEDAHLRHGATRERPWSKARGYRL
jgi:hypothetical protein